VAPVVLLILAMVWILLLAPAGWKKLSSRHAGASIESFHHELHLLQHSGPKLIAPAFRLETAHSNAAAACSRSGYPTVSSMPGRSPLVLLPPNEELREVGHRPAGTAQPGGAWETARAGGAWETARAGGAWETAQPGGGHQRARRRRRNTLGLLAGVVAGTGLVGLAPPLHGVWVLTGLCVAALACYLGLAAYAANLVAARPLGTRSSVARPAAPATGGWYHVDDLGQADGNWAEDPYEEEAGWRQAAAAR